MTQVRPGRLMTLLLATLGVSAVGVGSMACLSLLFMWLFVGSSSTSQPSHHTGKLPAPDLEDTLSEEADSGADLDSGASPVLPGAVWAAWLLPGGRLCG